MEASTQPPEPERDSGTDAFAERPEIYIGAAFVGGIVLAQALRLLGR